MTNWLLRGLAFAGAMVVLRLIQGVLINVWQTQSSLISVVLVILFVIAVVVWGLFDGRDDARANPDPDRRRDLAMVWLIAGLVAGALSGAVSWLIGLFDRALYVSGLLNELTMFAAFTALLVFIPAMGGVLVGRWLTDRELEKAPRRHHGLAAGDEDQADTDVFAAVSAGGETTAPEAGAEGASTTSAASDYGASTANRPTEEYPADAEETTGEIPRPDEETTGEIPTQYDNPDDRSS